VERAVEYSQQALTIARETGNRGNECSCLLILGDAYQDLQLADRAIEHYQQAVEIGDDTGSAETQAKARLGLAQVHLDRDEWPQARQLAGAVSAGGFRPVLAQAFALLGITWLREGDRANAGDAFSAALSAANTLLAGVRGPIRVLYAKGVASAGHALTGRLDAAQAARQTFEQAQTVSPTHGLRARALRQLDLLVLADPDGVLTGIRHVLAGQPHDNV
jgi:tetratricopeptide (TPR) repeat protein